MQANWLKSVGIGKGDAVAIYMGMTCELPSALLPPFSSQPSPCQQLGAGHESSPGV
jgi:hypothetical protein